MVKYAKCVMAIVFTLRLPSSNDNVDFAARCSWPLGGRITNVDCSTLSSVQSN